MASAADCRHDFRGAARCVGSTELGTRVSAGSRPRLTQIPPQAARVLAKLSRFSHCILRCTTTVSELDTALPLHQASSGTPLPQRTESPTDRCAACEVRP